MVESHVHQNSKAEDVYAHAVAILSVKMAELVAAGADLADAVAHHEGRIANPALDRWQAAVAAAHSDRLPDPSERQAWEAPTGNDPHKQGGGL
jgi:hypothetical protein